MQNDILAVAMRVTHVLESIGVKYFIGGSIASTLHGLVRTTQDVDIITALNPDHIKPFVNQLQEDFYLDVEMIQDAIVHQRSFNIIHRESMFKIDLFAPLPGVFTQSQMSRARKEILSSDSMRVAYVASPEDTILAKLEWFRKGGEVSERQWRDVVGILKVQGDALDFEYLARMARELQLEVLLERAVSDKGTR
jgi:hypothetical protein